MRGKVAGAIAETSKYRITPAYAGKSYCHVGTVQLAKDHPRVCGEKSCVVYAVPRALGSPPRMRGKVDVLPEVDALIGITPAYAGKRHWDDASQHCQ